MEFNTQRLAIKLAFPGEEEKILMFYEKNKEFLKDYEIEKPDNFYTLDFQHKMLATEIINTLKGVSYRFYIYEKDNFDKIIGTFSLGFITGGCLQNAVLGYKMDKDYTNKGLMTEALKVGIKYAFENLGLHRLEAYVMPKNVCSSAVMTKLGFKNEGICEKYIQINGKWEDHYRYSLINAHFSY